MSEDEQLALLTWAGSAWASLRGIARTQEVPADVRALLRDLTDKAPDAVRQVGTVVMGEAAAR